MSLLERRPGTENTPTMGGGRMEGDMGGGWKSNGITEAGGRWCSGAKISFYGRVTNLRTRHCRVPADGRTMRLRNTMLHSGNLKAVLTTNLQPPRTTTLRPSISHPPASTNARSFDMYHLPPLPSTLLPLAPVFFSFFQIQLVISCLFPKTWRDAFGTGRIQRSS